MTRRSGGARRWAAEHGERADPQNCRTSRLPWRPVAPQGCSRASPIVGTEGVGAIVSGTSSSDTPPGPPAAGVPHASAPTAHRVRSVLAIPAFRRLWLVTAVSATGDWLSLLALSALATQLATGYQAQSFALGGVVATKLLPALVLGPLAGALADKFDRRRVMVICDLLRFALFLSIPLVGSLWWLLVATLLIEMCALFWIPAKDASVPNLLRRPDQIETANQLALVMTYGVAVITASGLFTVISGLGAFLPGSTPEISTAYVALVLNGLAYLLTAPTVWFRIREISGRAAQRRAAAPGLLALLRDGSGSSRARRSSAGWSSASSGRSPPAASSSARPRCTPRASAAATPRTGCSSSPCSSGWRSAWAPRRGCRGGCRTTGCSARPSSPPAARWCSSRSPRTCWSRSPRSGWSAASPGSRSSPA